MNLTLDCREHKLSEYLHTSGINFEKHALDVGDIVIHDQNENLQIIIERKTWSDLKSSLLDGRFREQRSRLLQLESESLNMKICYLIEGEYNTDFMNEKKALYRLQFTYKIPCFFSYNIQSTTNIIKEWMNYSSLSNFFVEQRSVEVDQIEARLKGKKKNFADRKLFFLASLSLIKGIPVNISQAIVSEFVSLENFVKTYIENNNEWNAKMSKITYKTRSNNEKNISKKVIDSLKINFFESSN